MKEQDIDELYKQQELKTGQCPACGQCNAVLQILSVCKVCNEEVVLWDRDMKENTETNYVVTTTQHSDELVCMPKSEYERLKQSEKILAELKYLAEHDRMTLNFGLTYISVSELERILESIEHNHKIEKEHYEKLKRLDENAKKAIEDLISFYDSKTKDYFNKIRYEGDRIGLFHISEFLESLYE
jgi:hypothetical protein